MKKSSKFSVSVGPMYSGVHSRGGLDVVWFAPCGQESLKGARFSGVVAMAT